jgi:Flp pilus assembly protein TadG
MINSAASLQAAKKDIRHNEDGAAAVEFAIVSSVLIVLCLGIMQFGMALQVRNEMARAADKAVRVVMLNPDLSDADFKAEVYKALPHYSKERLSLETGQTTIDATEFRTLEVGYALGVFVPGLPADAITLTVNRQTPVL